MMNTPPSRIGVWALVWSNPTKARPAGFPEIVLQITTPLERGQGAGRPPQELIEAWEEMHLYGYTISWHLESPPAKQLPLASKQRIRRRNLWKRLLAKAPMFLEAFYVEQVQARPDYYGPLVAGEWADIVFARTTMGNLKQMKQEHST